MSTFDTLRIELPGPDEITEFDAHRHVVMLSMAPEMYYGSADYKRFMDRVAKQEQRSK